MQQNKINEEVLNSLEELYRKHKFYMQRCNMAMSMRDKYRGLIKSLMFYNLYKIKGGQREPFSLSEEYFKIFNDLCFILCYLAYYSSEVQTLGLNSKLYKNLNSYLSTTRVFASPILNSKAVQLTIKFADKYNLDNLEFCVSKNIVNKVATYAKHLLTDRYLITKILTLQYINVKPSVFYKTPLDLEGFVYEMLIHIANMRNKNAYYRKELLQCLN